MIPDMPRRTPLKAGLLLLWLLGLIGAALWSLEPPTPRPADSPLELFSAARSLRHVRALAHLPHPTGTSAHDQACDYIVQQLREMGLRPQIQTAVVVAHGWQRPYHAASVRNVVACLPGRSGMGSPALLLVAHYDSVPTGPGASDDTASAAALLETARALLYSQPAHGPFLNDIVLLWTDGEEAGLFGAKAFVEEYVEEKEKRRKEKGHWLKAEARANATAVQRDSLSAFSFLLSSSSLVLNFEARGVSGPSLLFETGANNSALVRAFAQAAPQPTASSLFYAVYKILPNDSDFTEFKKAGLRGLNFAFIDGVARYHTTLDDLAHLDARSLQQQGDIMLESARCLADTNAAEASVTVAPAREAAFPAVSSASPASDVIYFNVTRAALAIYPETCAVPLAVCATLLTAALFVYNLRNRHYTGRGLMGGLLYAVLAAGGGAIIGLLCMRLMPLIAPSPRSTLYAGNATLIGTILLALSLTWGLWTRHAPSARSTASISQSAGFGASNLNAPSPDNVIRGAMLLWLALAWLTALHLPGGSYLFAWPLLFALASEWVSTLRSRLCCASTDAIASSANGNNRAIPGTIAVFVAQMASAASVLLLMVPVLRLLFAALSLTALPVVGVLAALCAGLLHPHLALLSQAWPARPFALPLVVGTAGLILLGVGTAALRPTAAHPQFNSIFYGLDADTGQAIWASDDLRPDAWTTQFLGRQPLSGPLPALLPVSAGRFLQAPAPAIVVAPPTAILQSERTEGNARILQIHIASPRHAPLIEIAAPGAKVVDASIEGQSVGGNQGLNHAWSLLYFNVPPDGITLTLRVPGQSTGTSSKEDLKSTLTLRVVDRSYGLPILPGHPYTPRPAAMIATPATGWYQDTVLVGRTYRF